jgi:predicted RNA-binding protein YlxR (DUF448 family)
MSVSLREGAFTGEDAGATRDGPEVLALRKRHVPLRRCVVCGTQRPKAELIRIARTQEGRLEVGAPPKAPGRGAYVCRSTECLQRAAQGRPVSRSLDRPLPEDGAQRLRELADELSGQKQDAGS